MGSGVSGDIGDGGEPALASADPLTGLGDMRHFQHAVGRLIAERAGQQLPFAIGILDLDGFKPISDLLGKQAGDEILTQAAARLSAAMDEAATVTRVGLDEFAFLYPSVASEGGAAGMARVLAGILAAPYDAGGRMVRMSASFGCSLFQAADETTETLIRKAQTALYLAKRSGRGRVIVYTQEMEEAATRTTRIEQAFRRAVAAGDIEPHFQPIVDLRTRRTIGLETLARWTDPDLGPISPEVFIPIAEERGLIGELSRMVLEKATQASRGWPKDLFLSFNLSPSQLVDGNTGADLILIMERSGFDPRRLQVEITENGFMTDPASAAKTLHALRGLGIRIALDDFGTGQSSLGRLRDFRFDKLKIDRTFIDALLDDRSVQHIVRAILAMCKDLDMDVVAEGIEREEQARLLLELGCDKGQGFLFGQPLDAAAALERLREDRRGDAGA